MQDENEQSQSLDNAEMQSGQATTDHETDQKSRRTVVIAMDESKDSYQALEFYVNHIHQENDDLTALYCVHHKAHHHYGSLWMPVDPNIVVHKYHKETQKGKELCERLQEKLDCYQIGGKVIQLEGGDPGHVIVKKIHDMDADLTVVGCRGHGTVRRKLLGSVSEYILHHAYIPVIVCRH